MRPGDVLWLQIAVGFYVPTALAAAAWIAWWHGAGELWTRLLGHTIGTGIAVGITLGAVLLIGTRAASHMGWIHELEVALIEHIGPLRPRTCVVLAATSAVGEELVFRAVLQPAIGWFAATVVFALVHAPVDRGLARWPAFAFAAGAGFALAYELTGGVLAPALAHFLVNAVNLVWLTRRAAAADAVRP
ncbi:MAG: membrane protease YdiL (CAAX protease family) [Myxococcota bacterium]|jgi:membrane protease YdiL (CAAX protease family)